MGNHTPRIRFDLASPEDDAALRRLVAAVEMEGKIRISFQREPSYLQAASVEGSEVQVLVARDRINGQLVGTGTRSIRKRFVNGEEASVGYLSTLRGLPSHRGGMLLARAYRHLARLHKDERATLYVTTITADNATALHVLTGSRAGLPTYAPAGDYHTLALRARRRRRSEVPRDLEIRSATEADLPMLVAFLQREARKRQFAPCYEAEDFFRPEGTFRNLRPGDINLALREDQLVGTLATWDQSGFRQTIVSGYAPLFAALRGPHNAWARLRGAAELPRPGAALRYRTLALPFVERSDPGVFRALLETMMREHVKRSASDPSSRLALLGLHETDPLLSVAQPFSSRTYVTRMFVVHWQDGVGAHSRLDSRPTYLELGCL